MSEREALVAMVDAAMVEMRNISPPLRRSECERLIKAALSAPQQEPVASSIVGAWQRMQCPICESVFAVAAPPSGVREGMLRAAEIVKKAIKTCEAISSIYRQSGNKASCLEWQTARSAMRVVVDNITAALAEKDDGWLKCSERLPNHGDRVQIVCEDADGDPYRTIATYNDNDYGPFIRDGGRKARNTTHWRPLPPLPKGNE